MKKQTQNATIIRFDYEKTYYLKTAKSILINPNLTDSGLRLLQLLIDTPPNQKISLEYYQKLMGWSNTKMDNAKNNLKENGYLEINGFKNNAYFKINEFGILTKKEIKTIKKETSSTPIEVNETPKLEDKGNENISTTQEKLPEIDFEEVKKIIIDIVDKHFPSIPNDMLLDYIKKIADSIKSNEIKSIKLFSEKNVIKSISKIYQEPIKENKSNVIDYSIITPIEELNKVFDQERAYINMMQILKIEKGIKNGEIFNIDNLLDIINPNRHIKKVEVYISKKELESMIDASKTKSLSIDDIKAIKLNIFEWFNKQKNVSKEQASEIILKRKNAMRAPAMGGNQD